MLKHLLEQRAVIGQQILAIRKKRLQTRDIVRRIGAQPLTYAREPRLAGSARRLALTRRVRLHETVIGAAQRPCHGVAPHR